MTCSLCHVTIDFTHSTFLQILTVNSCPLPLYLDSHALFAPSLDLIPLNGSIPKVHILYDLTCTSILGICICVLGIYHVLCTCTSILGIYTCVLGICTCVLGICTYMYMYIGYMCTGYMYMYIGYMCIGYMYIYFGYMCIGYMYILLLC